MDCMSWVLLGNLLVTVSMFFYGVKYDMVCGYAMEYGLKYDMVYEGALLLWPLMRYGVCGALWSMASTTMWHMRLRPALASYTVSYTTQSNSFLFNGCLRLFCGFGTVGSLMFYYRCLFMFRFQNRHFC